MFTGLFPLLVLRIFKFSVRIFFVPFLFLIAFFALLVIESFYFILLRVFQICISNSLTFEVVVKMVERRERKNEGI